MVVGSGAASKAAAAAAANGEDASRLVGGQPTMIPAALSTEAAAAAAVGSGAGLTRRKGWFSRSRAGKGVAADGTLADTQDGEEKPKEQPVKVGRLGGDMLMLAGVMWQTHLGADLQGRVDGGSNELRAGPSMQHSMTMSVQGSPQWVS